MAIAVLFIAIAFYIMPTAKNIITIAKFNKTVAEYIIAVEKFDKTIEKFDKAVAEYIIAVAKFDKPTAKPKMTGDKSLKPTAELKHHTENCVKQTEVQTESGESLVDSET